MFPSRWDLFLRSHCILVSNSNVDFLSFSMFCGVAMSITAFPVLARILTDRKLQSTQVGTVAIGCAAADDVTAWCLLAIIVGIVKSNLHEAAYVLTGAVAFIVIMVFLVRPLWSRWAYRYEVASEETDAFPPSILFSLILLCAWTTEAIGIHSLFGAFCLGAIVPSHSKIAKYFVLRIKTPVQVLLLPAFFAYTGMRTNIGLLGTGEYWLWCIVIILVATIGKFGGTFAAARLMGESWRESAALGALMNTRGLMELIVLNIGLDLGIISPPIFTMMVIMAIATTIATAPVLQILIPTPSSSTC